MKENWLGILSAAVLWMILLQEMEACSSYLTLHEIMAVDGGVVVIDDEGGLREIKATTFSVGACTTSSTFSTGSQFEGNYSLLGISTPLGSGNCVTKDAANNIMMESMQAVVIKTNGWLLEPQSIDMDDIDSQMDVPANEAWMEAAAAFGVANGEVILPETQFAKDTLLASREFLIPKDAMNTMGLSLEESLIPGAEFSGAELYNCPFAKSSPDAAKCRMKISFENPVDTLVLLYGLKQQSYSQTDSAMFVSQIDMKCGCRCVAGSTGSREVALPLSHLEGQCSKTLTTSPRTECDILGKKWCTMESSYAYKILGEGMQNGNYPCFAEKAFTSRVLSNFAPSESFVSAS